MKNLTGSKHIFFSAILAISMLLLTPRAIFSQDSKPDENPLELSIAVGLAVYPESTHTGKSGTHFAGICGAYDSLQAAVTGAAAYTLPFMQADNMLMEDNHVTFTASLELSPVSCMPAFEITFSPLALLELSCGGMAGTGWDFTLADAQGAGEYNLLKRRYEPISTFNQWYLNTYGRATLMFDTGAIWEGDWTHIVMTASYSAGYQKLTGTGNVWQWQLNPYPMANGWIYEQDYFLGYQMPTAVSLVGVDLTLSGHYNSSDFDASQIAKSYDGGFMQISIMPVAQIKLGKTNKDTLGIFALINSRRTFFEEWKDWDTEPLLTKNGREFFLDCFGFEWKHIF